MTQPFSSYTGDFNVKSFHRPDMTVDRKLKTEAGAILKWGKAGIKIIILKHVTNENDEDNLTTEHEAVDEDGVTNEDYYTTQDYVANYN